MSMTENISVRQAVDATCTESYVPNFATEQCLQQMHVTHKPGLGSRKKKRSRKVKEINTNMKRKGEE